MSNVEHVVIGAGPAGLGAAYELVNAGEKTTVLEKDPSYVGGISRTVEYNGYRFDLGGHRFFTTSPKVQEVWSAVLKGKLRTVPRRSRIFYGNQWYNYPLSAYEVLGKMGFIEALYCAFGYVASRTSFARVRTLEDALVRSFGRPLFDRFFKEYSEKVWGMKCHEISRDWATQRIRGLSASTLLKTAVLGIKKHGTRSLIDEFLYPDLGPGEMWSAMVDSIEKRSGRLLRGSHVTRLKRQAGRVEAVYDETGREFHADHVFSSMPLIELMNIFDPPAPMHIQEAAGHLRYRSLIVVVLVLDAQRLFPDNWVYINSRSHSVGRIQNYGNWSQHLLPNSNTSCLGMEYFANPGEELWEMKDEALTDYAKDELRSLSLSRDAKVLDSCVVRVPRAYPIYTLDYQRTLQQIRSWLSDNVSNLHTIGRAGMHNYGNMDHCMLMGMMAAQNAMGNGTGDAWKVNTKDEYVEANLQRSG